MKSNLHIITLLLLYFSSFYVVNAQSERLKLYSIENVSNKNDLQETKPNIPEKKNSTKFKEEIKKDRTHLKVSQISRDSVANIKLAADETYTKVQLDIKSLDTNKSLNVITTVSDNVTYYKETITENQPISTTEKSPTKVATSINYKSSILKEDVHIITNSTNVEITSNKRIYLQEEADDLQIEIKQNVNNPNYDLVQKQKLLGYIKTLLKN